MDFRWCFSVCQHVEVIRKEFLQAEGLPFEDLITESMVRELLPPGTGWNARFYSPLTTLLAFVWQCLSKSACRQVVAKCVAQCVKNKRRPCSSNTGGYCVARDRMPESLVKGLTRNVGHGLHNQAPQEWLWKGRKVKVVDGTTVSMPDTKENQEAYPQVANQKTGVGFPIARLLIVFSLAVGTVLEMMICACKGKEQSELAMLRQLLDTFEPDDVILGDRMHCTWFMAAALMARNVDFVLRMHYSRKCDFRRGKRLGKNDHIATWMKPRRPEWMSQEEYDSLPDSLEIRETRVELNIPGFRVQKLVVASSLLDSTEYKRFELTDLYRQRWHAELDLRSLKTALDMDVLRCMKPERIRKEIWANMLSYNLIRSVMAQAALVHGRPPRTMSFTATLQLLRVFQPQLEHATPQELLEIAEVIWRCIIQHPVGNRPDRVEPRQRKRRPKAYDLLQQPRSEARKNLVS